MILTFELDLDGVQSNKPAKYLGRRSFSIKRKLSGHTDPPTHTHTGPIALPGRLKWSAKKGETKKKGVK